MEKVAVRKRYSLPGGMRYSALSERRKFYGKEFDAGAADRWLSTHRDVKSTVFAVVIGRHTGIFPKRFSGHTEGPVLIDEHSGMGEVLGMVRKFLPEGVYYDRNIYRSLSSCADCGKAYGKCWGCEGFLGQELCFDIDPENIPCPKCGSLSEKMGRKQGLSFCEFELNEAKKHAIGLSHELEKIFSKVGVVYSGRGYHVHVFDKSAGWMERSERGELAQEMKEKGFAIDSWVTEGESRLIRLPYSLHGMVSRVAVPIEKKELPAFDPVVGKGCRPKFL